jgi:3'-phosphoadenosine 5'-phosphosulfate sulfotransferase (PAPS reductase)/FAD synthetase
MTDHPRIVLPDAARDLVVIASLSGGKDSTALVCALREAEIPHRTVFADTGWEAPETYEYLYTLRRVLGIAIDVVGVPGGMRAKIRERAGFPARMQRWCTRELKVFPLRAYHDAICERENTDTVSVVGIRAEESETRAKMAPFEDDPRWGGYVWRPLLHWTVADVLAIHHRHGVPVNPLYQRGHSRVGCWPCIYASKEEIRLWSEHDPASVAEVRALEQELVAVREERNAETPGRYAYPDDATFFMARQAVRNADGRAYTPMNIDTTIEWSRTTRGGRQLPLIREDPDGGCFRWGMCEPPTRDEEK